MFKVYSVEGKCQHEQKLSKNTVYFHNSVAYGTENLFFFQHVDFIL